jgi:hypothetical protein
MHVIDIRDKSTRNRLETEQRVIEQLQSHSDFIYISFNANGDDVTWEQCGLTPAEVVFLCNKVAHAIVSNSYEKAK